MTMWFGVMAPACTPPDAVSTLDAAFAKISHSAELKAHLAKL